MAGLECRLMSEEWLPARLIYTGCSTLLPADLEDKCWEFLFSSCSSRLGGNHFGWKLVDQVRVTWLPNKVHRNGFDSDGASGIRSQCLRIFGEQLIGKTAGA